MLSDYSIPKEARTLLEQGIIANEKQIGLPREIAECARNVSFEGSSLPSIAINWRFAESMAALKGFEAAMINVLLGRRFNTAPLEATINTDHVQLLFMSSLVLQVEPGEEFSVNPTPVRELNVRYAQHFPTQDIHNMASSLYRRAATNIYKTKDGKFIHLHGSLNPGPTIAALEMPAEQPELKTLPESYQPYMKLCEQRSAEDLERLLNDQAKQACTIAHTLDEFQASEHGRANSRTGLYEVHHRDVANQRPCWWQATSETSIRRPLAGLKVVDLTRVIAGPSVSRGLAELGASVMRVTAPHLPDFTGLHPDLNWGKWNSCLDLRVADDRAKLRALIEQADVVVDGYRPGVFDKYGFGVDNVLRLCNVRPSGVIYARENSYVSRLGTFRAVGIRFTDEKQGWKGPWRHRSGWQPISDANTGISYGFGRAMGRDEPCTPVFPNSDYWQALIERAEKGGSYIVDIALNYYNQWLGSICGTYPDEVWQDVWTRNGRKSFRHFESMNVTVPAYLGMLKDNAAEVLLREEFFERRRSEALKLEMQVVRPGIKFPPDTVQLMYNVGTRGNGIDQPFWPQDLLVEVVEEGTPAREKGW